MQLCRFPIVACLAAAGVLAGCRQNKPPTTKPVVVELKSEGGGSIGAKKVAGGNGGGGAGHPAIGAQAKGPSGQEPVPIESPRQATGANAPSDATTPTTGNKGLSDAAKHPGADPANNTLPAPDPIPTPTPGRANGDSSAPGNPPVNAASSPNKENLSEDRQPKRDAQATRLGLPVASPARLGMPLAAVNAAPVAANTAAIGMKVDHAKLPANTSVSGSLPLDTPAATTLWPHVPGPRLPLPSILTGLNDNTCASNSSDKVHPSSLAAPSIAQPSVSRGRTAQSLTLLSNIDATGNEQIAPQTRQRARSILAGADSTHFAVWTKGGGAALVLPREAVLKKVESARDREIMVMPLPGADRAVWQSTIDRAGSRLNVADWINNDGAAEIRRQDTARRAADTQADRAARDTVGRAFYRIILGDAPTTRPGRTEP